MQKMRRRKERQEHTYASTEYLCSCDVSCRTTTTAMTTTTMTTTTIGERPHLRLYFLFFFLPFHQSSRFLLHRRVFLRSAAANGTKQQRSKACFAFGCDVQAFHYQTHASYTYDIIRKQFFFLSLSMVCIIHRILLVSWAGVFGQTESAKRNVTDEIAKIISYAAVIYCLNLKWIWPSENHYHRQQHKEG